MPADRSTSTGGPAGGDEVDIDSEAGLLFTLEVGRRLRSVRHQHGLSLQQVEKMSEGRWSASTIGAYERGFRVLNLPRLHELALFYNVPMTALLGKGDTRVEAVTARRVVIDLVALDATDRSPAIVGYLRHIAQSRGDWNGAVLSIRDSDMWALAALMGTDEGSLVHELADQGVLVD
ncbi:MAG: helix-turn-helix domain-containing protein [Acidimicrobiales bacterium]